MVEPVVGTYQASDEAEVLDILRMALGETPTLPRTPGFWRWKHFENPFGPSQILVARIHGQVAGVRAYLRWRFLTPSGVVQAMRAVDTATSPSFQRRGVFRALTLEANKRAEAAGVDLIFNTPNHNSLPGYLSMGWSVVGKPRVYLRPLRPLGILRRSSVAGELDPDAVLPVGQTCRFDHEIKDRPPLGFRTERSVDYFGWRFERHPTVPYRMIEDRGGVFIVRPNRRSSRIEVVVSEVLGGGHGPLRGLGSEIAADYLVGSARPGSSEARRFLRSGFVPAVGHGLTLVALPLTSTAQAALSLSAWDLSAGDLELM